MHTLTIDGREIGAGHRPYLIAEMSGNHNQSLARALEIVDAAAASGADAIKLQTYTADTLTLNVGREEFRINNPQSLWDGQTLYDLYAKAFTPWEWHGAIMEHARKQGLTCFSSPFDETAVDFLETLDVPAYKIASFENIHLPLIRKVAATGKPMIMSTGMASVAELGEAVEAARGAGCRELVLLKCTSTYPAVPTNSNLLTIPHLSRLFDCPVGLSDHTMGTGVAVAAVALGACVIEKHFTMRRADGGVDSAFSMEPEEFRALATETERAQQALGTIYYGPTDQERPSLAHRRSLYVSKAVKRGEKITSDNIRCVRPAKGLAPKFLDVVLGMTFAEDLEAGTPLAWELIR